MRCPDCGLQNPEGGIHCDSGYNFSTGKQDAKRVASGRGTSFGRSDCRHRTVVALSVLLALITLGIISPVSQSGADPSQSRPVQESATPQSRSKDGTTSQPRQLSFQTVTVQRINPNRTRRGGPVTLPAYRVNYGLWVDKSGNPFIAGILQNAGYAEKCDTGNTGFTVAFSLYDSSGARLDDPEVSNFSLELPWDFSTTAVEKDAATVKLRGILVCGVWLTDIS